MAAAMDLEDIYRGSIHIEELYSKSIIRIQHRHYVDEEYHEATLSLDAPGARAMAAALIRFADEADRQRGS